MKKKSLSELIKIKNMEFTKEGTEEFIKTMYAPYNEENWKTPEFKSEQAIKFFKKNDNIFDTHMFSLPLNYIVNINKLFNIFKSYGFEYEKTSHWYVFRKKYLDGYEFKYERVGFRCELDVNNIQYLILYHESYFFYDTVKNLYNTIYLALLENSIIELNNILLV